MTARLRPELVGLPAYIPGKTVPGSIKLASNETVFGPLPSVRAAIERATDQVHRYPDNACVQLKAALAKHLSSTSSADFAPEQVAVSCGAVSLCQQVIQITASAGDEVVMGWHSFELYPPMAQVAGAVAVVAADGINAVRMARSAVKQRPNRRLNLTMTNWRPPAIWLRRRRHGHRTTTTTRSTRMATDLVAAKATTPAILA